MARLERGQWRPVVVRQAMLVGPAAPALRPPEYKRGLDSTHG
jgi:hypothetical protein